MSLTVHDIGNVLEEIAPAIRGGWIQKIHQPAARTLVFEIRVPGRTHRLLVSCAPESSRLHVLSQPLPNPATPPAFCQFLRAHLQGAHLDDLRQMPDDRIVEWGLTTREGPRSLICELTGRHANLIVVDAEGFVVRDLNGTKEAIGRPYHRPEKRSPGVQRSVRCSGVLSGEGFPLSVAIERHYQDREATQAIDAARDARLRALKNALKKEQRRLEAWQKDLAGAAKFQTYARYGELLKASLGSIKKGMDRIALPDYFDESMPEVTIPLDPTKSVQGNMDDYFRKHRKYLTAERELRPRIEQAQQTIVGLRQELTAIEQGIWTPPASPPGRSAPGTDRPKRQDKGQQRHGPFRRFTSTDGLQILVGRNARENDELTFGLAKGDDLWLHASGTPGSHVVVRLDRGKDPPPETLRDAATLALLYSDLKKSGRGEVIYTRRKWVKKAKGQAAGAVIVTREQSLQVGLDKNRLAALKERSSLEA